MSAPATCAFAGAWAALLRTPAMSAAVCAAPLRRLLLAAAPALAASLHRATMALAPLTAAARRSPPAFAPLVLAFAIAEGCFLPLAKALSAALEASRADASPDSDSKGSQTSVSQGADSKAAGETTGSIGPPKNAVHQTVNSTDRGTEMNEGVDLELSRITTNQAAGSTGPRLGVDQSTDPELPAHSNTCRQAGGEGEAALCLLLFASFLFLLLSAPFASLRFALIAFGFEVSVTRIAAQNFFLLLPGLFCRQTFVFFSKLGFETELRLPQAIAGVIGVATNLLLSTLAPQDPGVWAASFSAGYGVALFTEIGLLCCVRAFRSIFKGCEPKRFCDNWAASCKHILSAFGMNFAEFAPFAIVFIIIARQGMVHLMAIALLLITEEAATVLTRALAVGVRSLEEKGYTAQILASVLVLIVGSLQSLLIFNCSAGLVHIYSDNRRVQVLYHSSLFGFLSFVLVTSVTKVWRSCLRDRRLAFTFVLLLSRWGFRLALGLLLTFLTSKSFLLCLPIILPLGAVMEATSVLLLFLNPWDCRHRASEKEKELLCPREKKTGTCH